MKRLAEKLKELGYVDQDGRIYKPLPTLKVSIEFDPVEDRQYHNLEQFLMVHKKVLAAKRKSRYNN